MTQSIADISEQQFEDMLSQQATMLNEDFVRNCHYGIAHLTSSRGKQLNGQMCRVIGFSGDSIDSTRFLIQIDDQPILRIQKANLIPVQLLNTIRATRNSKANWILSDSDLRDQVENAINSKVRDGILTPSSRRNDAKYRAKLLKTFLANNGEKSTKIRCLASGNEGKELSRLDRLMHMSKVACCGDEIVDFRKFSTALENDMDGQVQLQKRFQEYILTGMCEMCQICMMEQEYD